MTTLFECGIIGLVKGREIDMVDFTNTKKHLKEMIQAYEKAYKEIHPEGGTNNEKVR